MKKIIFMAITTLLIASCNNAKLDKANEQNDSLTSVVDQRDSSLYSFMLSFNEIESNLDSVAAKQHIIAMNSNKSKGEFGVNKKAKIKAEIAAINDLMDKNRREMEDLKRKLKGSKHSNALLEKTMKTLTIQLSQKDYELCELKLTLNALNVKVGKLLTTVDSLSVQNYIKSVVIDYQATDIHTGYYIVGFPKELRAKNVIDRKGGLLGIGRTSTLSKDFDSDVFTQIDYTKTISIPVDGIDVNVVSNHPTESYRLQKDAGDKDLVTNLVIINPVLFWSTSKYLVILKH